MSYELMQPLDVPPEAPLAYLARADVADVLVTQQAADQYRLIPRIAIEDMRGSTARQALIVQCTRSLITIVGVGENTRSEILAADKPEITGAVLQTNTGLSMTIESNMTYEELLAWRLKQFSGSSGDEYYAPDSVLVHAMMSKAGELAYTVTLESAMKAMLQKHALSRLRGALLRAIPSVQRPTSLSPEEAGCKADMEVEGALKQTFIGDDVAVA